MEKVQKRDIVMVRCSTCGLICSVLSDEEDVSCYKCEYKAQEDRLEAKCHQLESELVVVKNELCEVKSELLDVKSELVAMKVAKSETTKYRDALAKDVANWPKPSQTSDKVTKQKNVAQVKQNVTMGDVTAVAKDAGVVMIGSSNVRRVAQACHDEFGRSENVIFESMSGAKAEQVGCTLQGAIDRCSAKKVDVILHVGCNDIAVKGSETVVNDIIDTALEASENVKTRNVYVCSVVPRNDNSVLYSRSESVNNRLVKKCSEFGMMFVDLRSEIQKCKFQGLDRSGFHYNRAGASAVFRQLVGSTSIEGFLGK